MPAGQENLLLVQFFTYLAREKVKDGSEKRGTERAQRAIKNSSKPVDSKAAYKLEREAVKKAQSDDPILNMEDTVKGYSSSFSEWFFGS